MKTCAREGDVALWQSPADSAWVCFFSMSLRDRIYGGLVAQSHALHTHSQDSCSKLNRRFQNLWNSQGAWQISKMNTIKI